ncbi:hypothetical protein AB0C02_21685 [Micromonospora sp. NPDC048999]|uniref:hypothetical protein n=1 Tax=Micromonospora sp. NPDC048999 TaxID=3155391 RepID=UPI0033C8E3E0
MAEYALYAWGNYLREAELDRLPEWLEPAVLSGERVFVHPHVSMSDEGPLRVDVSRSLFAVEGEFVSGRDLAPAVTGDWRVSYLRLVTDESADDAERMIEDLEEQGWDLDRDDDPDWNPLPIGEIVTGWEDPHGQWDLALIRL